MADTPLTSKVMVMVALVIGILLIAGLVVPVIVSTVQPTYAEERTDNPATPVGYPLTKTDSFSELKIQNKKVGNGYDNYNLEVVKDGVKTGEIHFPNHRDDGDDTDWYKWIDSGIPMVIYADGNLTFAIRGYDGMVYENTAGIYELYTSINPYDWGSSYAREQMIIFTVTNDGTDTRYLMELGYGDANSLHVAMDVSGRSSDHAYIPLPNGGYDTYLISDLSGDFADTEVTFWNKVAVAPSYITERTEEPLPTAFILIQIVPLLMIAGVVIGAVTVFVRKQ